MRTFDVEIKLRFNTLHELLVVLHRRNFETGLEAVQAVKKICLAQSMHRLQCGRKAQHEA